MIGWLVTIPNLSLALGEHATRCDLLASLNPFITCDVLTEICKAHMMYELSHGGLKVGEMLQLWQYVWSSLTTVLQDPLEGSDHREDASRRLEHVYQLRIAMQEPIRVHADPQPFPMSGSDFLLPLILALQRVVHLSSSISYTNGNSGGHQSATTYYTFDPTTPEAVQGDQSAQTVLDPLRFDILQNFDITANVQDTYVIPATPATTLQEQPNDSNFLTVYPLPIERSSSSSTISGSFVTALDSSRSQTPLGLLVTDADLHNENTTSTDNHRNDTWLSGRSRYWRALSSGYIQRSQFWHPTNGVPPESNERRQPSS